MTTILHPPSAPGTSLDAPATPRAGGFGRLLAYVRIARPDHWFKNAFMLLGVLVAFFCRPELFVLASLAPLALGLAATCLVCSSNYVLNELLDAPLDRLHPTKRNRPAAAGLVSAPAALAEWLVLGALGVGLGFAINPAFGFAALLLWVMGCLYNIPPVRTKDVAYLDVLSESVNNPIRLLLGWHVLIPDMLPPLTLLLAYWMVGAYFMATKRFAEYRRIQDPLLAARYRRSFEHYDEERLLVSMMFYAAACALFGGVFIVRYRLELVACVPLLAGFFAYYFKLGLRPDSPVQNPERLHGERRFLGYLLATVGLFVALMFTDIPVLYDLFNVEPSHVSALWSLGG